MISFPQTPVHSDISSSGSRSHWALLFACVCLQDAHACVLVCVYVCVHPQIRGCCWRSAVGKCQSTSANERYQQYLVASVHTHVHTPKENKPGAMARHTTCQLCTTMAPSINSMQERDGVAGSSYLATV